MARGALVPQLLFPHRARDRAVPRKFGLSPKTLARVLRFLRAVAIIKHGGGPCLAETAEDCGYYDQAHFTRDFHAFAGVTPTAVVRSQSPEAPASRPTGKIHPRRRVIVSPTLREWRTKT
jgi:AraC-like DNA-binding protein